MGLHQVQHALLDARSFAPPAGWQRAAVTGVATVFERNDEPPWPDSRLAATAGDYVVRVEVVHQDGTVRTLTGFRVIP